MNESNNRTVAGLKPIRLHCCALTDCGTHLTGRHCDCEADCDLGEEQQNQPLQAEGLAMLPPTLPPKHGIAAEWRDVYECRCGALVGKATRDIDHFTIHGVARP